MDVGVRFQGCRLDGASLEDADLDDADLDDADSMLGSGLFRLDHALFV